MWVVMDHGFGEECLHRFDEAVGMAIGPIQHAPRLCGSRSDRLCVLVEVLEKFAWAIWLEVFDRGTDMSIVRDDQYLSRQCARILLRAPGCNGHRRTP